MYKSYILIDTNLLGESCEKFWIKKERHPNWIAPLYGRNAIEVSPIIIDIEQALQASKMSVVMKMVNAQQPQLGISFIESTMPLVKIVKHLQNFIYVRTTANKELTLRFADCAVLPALATVFNPSQWAALTKPFKSWKIHDRDGNMVSLPIIVCGNVSELPLILLDDQIFDLRELMAADQLLFNLRIRRPAENSIYLNSIGHEYAAQSRSIWYAAGNIDDADLILFTEYIFESKGHMLRSPNLLSVVANKNRSEMHASLRKMVNI